MKQGSSFLFATWSFLSLYAVAGLCTVAPPPQHGVPFQGLAQPQVRSSQSQAQLQASPRHRARSQGEAPSRSGHASRSRLQQQEPLQASPSRRPALRPFAASRPANTGVCTFMAYQVQVCNQDSSTLERVNYLQINTIYAPDSTVAADVRQQRPTAEFSSYNRLHANEAWDIATLKDSHTLTITLNERDGDLRFTYGEVSWTEQARAQDGEGGWCEDTEWYVGGEDWDCIEGEAARPRKRNLPCSFPCARIERLELR